MLQIQLHNFQLVFLHLLMLQSHFPKHHKVLVLQILPQAIPPEYMQAALSPASLNGMPALARYLNNTCIDSQGDELENGVRQIREQIKQQIRASGSLNSGDYDEPDAADAEATPSVDSD